VIGWLNEMLFSDVSDQDRSGRRLLSAEQQLLAVKAPVDPFCSGLFEIGQLARAAAVNRHSPYIDCPRYRFLK
jgi:hypothetical protein